MEIYFVVLCLTMASANPRGATNPYNSYTGSTGYSPTDTPFPLITPNPPVGPTGSTGSTLMSHANTAAPLRYCAREPLGERLLRLAGISKDGSVDAADIDSFYARKICGPRTPIPVWKGSDLVARCDFNGDGFLCKQRAHS